MAPNDVRRPYKRPAISDQQRRRELALLRQCQQRSDSQNRARCLASSVLALRGHADPTSHADIEIDTPPEPEPEPKTDSPERDLDLINASKLKGSDARRWFARQLMLPEWMVDIPPNLERDWTMAPNDVRRPYKRPAISDQQRRRELALLRQCQQRSDSQNRDRCLASSVLALRDHADPTSHAGIEIGTPPDSEPEPKTDSPERDLDLINASKLKGSDARRWFARQLMLPEWMVDIPPNLERDWYVSPRPAGKRCLVVSSNGTTVSRLRNGSVLHHFPSSLPNGARIKDMSGPGNAYCVLDCVFHEVDQTYYTIDIVCWRGYSLYDCTAEFRFFWLNSKLSEAGVCNPPSQYHRYQFSVVPIYECDNMGIHAAYSGAVPYIKDGLLFYNKHAHYQTGNTPLALVWKDEVCSQYFLDTDSKGQIPAQQQVVLELQDDGKLTTSDDPPVVLGCLDGDTIQKSGIRKGNQLKFAIREESVRLVNGKLEIGDLHFMGKSNRSRSFADSYSKVLFQYAARHSPVRIGDLVASILQNLDENHKIEDTEMGGG